MLCGAQGVLIDRDGTYFRHVRLAPRDPRPMTRHPPFTHPVPRAAHTTLRTPAV